MVHLLPSHRAPPRRAPLRRTSIAAGSALVLALAGAAADPARAQARLEAGYTISVARIPIGSATAVDC